MSISSLTDVHIVFLLGTLACFMACRYVFRHAACYFDYKKHLQTTVVPIHLTTHHYNELKYVKRGLFYCHLRLALVSLVWGLMAGIYLYRIGVI